MTERTGELIEVVAVVERREIISRKNSKRLYYFETTNGSTKVLLIVTMRFISTLGGLRSGDALSARSDRAKQGGTLRHVRSLPRGKGATSTGLHCAFVQNAAMALI